MMVDGKQEFNAILLNKFSGDPIHGKLQFRELQPEEILLKVMTSTIHPADIAFTRGQYGRIIPDEFPIVPGSEGSGIIVEVGNLIDRNLIGKHVGVWANTNKKGKFHGIWAEYHYTNLDSCIIFDHEVDFKKITFAMGNPLTALGFLDTVKQHNVDAVVQNGATSAFGKMFIKLCALNKIKNISIVRKKEKKEKLIELGAYKVISTSETTWKSELKEAAKEVNALVCFECVGGEYTGNIISLMPEKSTIYHFGNLELKRLEQIDTSDFIFSKKILKGFWLMSWLMGKTKEEFLGFKKIIKESIESGEDLFLTEYSKTFNLDEFEEGFMYYFTHMSEGKIVFENNKPE